MTIRKFIIYVVHILFLLNHNDLQYFRMIMPEDRNDRMRKVVDMDLNTVKSDGESSDSVAFSQYHPTPLSCACDTSPHIQIFVQ